MDSQEVVEGVGLEIEAAAGEDSVGVVALEVEGRRDCGGSGRRLGGAASERSANRGLRQSRFSAWLVGL